jgi:hypothetical protein
MSQVLPPNQVDFLAQHLQLINLQRSRASPAGAEPSLSHFPTQNQMIGTAINNNSTAATNNLGMYSNAMISAAVEALQRSFQMHQFHHQQAVPSCSVAF